MNIADAVAYLVEQVPDPAAGLPDDVFFYISRTTPLVNVDLLIRDERGRTLLAWRNDQLAGEGWHVPGGIVRFKETLETRVRKVAETEIGAAVTFEPHPIALHQMMQQQRAVRGHFISLLFRCQLPRGFVPENRGLSSADPGFLKWHDSCPEDLLGCQAIYRRYIDDRGPLACEGLPR